MNRTQPVHNLSGPLTTRGRVLVCVGLIVVVASLWAGIDWWNTRWHQRMILSFDVQGTQVVAGSHCEEEARLRVEEHTDRVELTFEVRGARRGDCDDVAVATLSQVLGDRALIDTDTGQRPLNI